MPAIAKPRRTLENDLLDFYDDLTALYASISFVLESLAAAIQNTDSSSVRAATGAVFCVEWLNTRMEEVDNRLKEFRSQRN